MTPEEQEEARLLAMLSEDSQYAFQLLFDRHKDHIYKVAMLYVKSPLIAEEIVQDVFIKVWLNRKELYGIQSFESWLYVVSRNFTVNYMKRLAVEWRASLQFMREQTTQDDNADHRVRSAQYNELLQQALLQLSEQQLAVYRLAKEGNLSYKEIADRLQISPLTVKTHLSRAMHAIRAHFRRHGEILPQLSVAALIYFF